MTKRKKLSERRRHKRLQAKEGTLAVLGRHRVTVGKIVDMSMGGLAVRYIAEDVLSKEPCRLDILMADGLSHLYGPPCETVYDIEAKTAVPLTSMVERRRGLKFGKLTPTQKLHLEDFINNHTAGEVEETYPVPLPFHL
ncbi:MAG: PilZ domain-containing protein [Deltaproteobacteria bacterium]|nr:PilZ domain-containing protein [Deltaproteobacteria bacterium]